MSLSNQRQLLPQNLVLQLPSTRIRPQLLLLQHRLLVDDQHQLELLHLFHQSLSAEILWTLKSVTSSSNDSNLLFQRMFPDSNIAQKFSCGETKCTYLGKFGLVLHFQQLMMKSLKESGEFVVLFDESLNSVTQSKQLDVHIRTWRNGEVTLYLPCFSLEIMHMVVVY